MLMALALLTWCQGGVNQGALVQHSPVTLEQASCCVSVQGVSALLATSPRLTLRAGSPGNQVGSGMQCLLTDCAADEAAI